MISHERFGKLRLAQFLPRAGLVELANWEFMDRTWLGEALGFSEWLRLETDHSVSCTVLERGGLSYLVVMTPLDGVGA